LPTYETKDLGLVILKDKDYPEATRSIVITANEQSEYFKVMLAALAEIDPGLAKKTTHLSHGFVNLSTGKMSSRTGDVYSAESLITEVEKAANEQFPDAGGQGQTAIAALKYDFLKSSILAKAGENAGEAEGSLDDSERSLALKISQYPEIIEKAADELMPHHIATYLYELAQTFNSFYEKSRIIGDGREAIRLKLVRTYKDVLKSGLEVLNITAPEKI
jgi:arginyl-tRNA synthetase